MMTNEEYTSYWGRNVKGNTQKGDTNNFPTINSTHRAALPTRNSVDGQQGLEETSEGTSEQTFR